MTLSKEGPHCLEFVGRPMVEDSMFCWSDSPSSRGAGRMAFWLPLFWLLPSSTQHALMTCLEAEFGEGVTIPIT